MRDVKEAFSFVPGSHAEYQHVVLADLGLRTNLSKLCVLAVSKSAISPTMHCHEWTHKFMSVMKVHVNIIVIIILANTISVH